MGFLSYNSLGHSPLLREVKAGTQGRKLEAAADAEAIGEHCLRAYPSWLAQPSYRTQELVSSEMAPPTVSWVLS